MKRLDKLTTADFWKGFDSDLWNMGIDPSDRPLQKYDETVNLMRMIEGSTSVKNIKSIDFDLKGEPRYEHKMLAELPQWIETIVSKIDPDDKWMVFYQYHDAWRSRKLDEVTSELLVNQCHKDLDGRKKARALPNLNVMVIQAEDYDFMPVDFNEIQAMRIVNVGNYNTKIQSSGKVEEAKAEVKKEFRSDIDWEAYEQYRQIKAITNDANLIETVKRGILQKLKDQGKSPKKRMKSARMIKGGSFWKWLLKLPINLERYMIFNELNSRTAKLMEEDNCLIYACKQFGLPQDIIDHMKDIIKVKHFSLAKLKEIANETGVTFLVEEKDGRKHTQGDGKGTIVPLLLFENHYMINERVKISPYYVRHIHEINADKNASKWTLEKKQIIDRTRVINGKTYYAFDQPDYPLKLVLKTIFEVNGFEPMKMGDYITYASSLYKYKLDPIDDLEYNPKFCCKLKAPNVRGTSNLLYGVNEG